MAVCDGELAEIEREFLTSVAVRLEVPLNLDEVERNTREYRVAVKRSISEKIGSSVRDTSTTASGKVKGALGKVLKRGTDAEAAEASSG